MSITIAAQDMVMTALALLGVIMFAGAALALLVQLLGRKAPDLLESVARVLLVEAEGLRARERRKVELANSQPTLALRPAVEVTE